MHLKVVVTAIAVIILAIGLPPRNLPAENPPTATETPDTILHNGKIITVDKDFNIAEALAIRGKTFLAVGSNEKILALAGPDTKKVDLKGKTVVPGFIDPHNHVDSIGWLRLNFRECKTIADVVKVVENDGKGKKPGEWVISGRAGGAPGPEKLPAMLKEKRNPNRWDLDPVSPNNPVWLYAPHISVVNSYLLKLAGITKETPDPSGGSIGRDPKTGEPTGILTERAIQMVSKLAPPTTYEDILASVKKGSEYYNSRGITSIKSEVVSPDGLRALLELRSKNLLPLRVSASISAPDLGRSLKEIEGWLNTYGSVMAAYAGIGDNMLRVEGAGEFGIDGGTGSGSAFQRFQYVGGAGKLSYGDQKVSQERFTQISLLCAQYNLRMNVHASGGAALDLTLNAWEEVNKQIPITEKRWNIHHVQAPSKANFEQIKKLGVTIETDVVKMTSTVLEYYGKEVGENLNPLRDWLDNGVRIALASDAEVGAPDPLLWIHQATTRILIDGNLVGPHQKITVKEALIASTINGAYATFEENMKGSIEKGKLADLVLLSDDIFSVPVDKIKDIKVLMTMVGGKMVYEEGK